MNQGCLPLNAMVLVSCPCLVLVRFRWPLLGSFRLHAVIHVVGLVALGRAVLSSLEPESKQVLYRVVTRPC